jgi:hypothetical protein
MPGSGYASQTEAIRAAQETLRATFGEQIRFEPIPPNASLPRVFRVLDDHGHYLKSFGVFKVRTGQEWAWLKASLGRDSD